MCLFWSRSLLKGFAFPVQFVVCLGNSNIDDCLHHVRPHMNLLCIMRIQLFAVGVMLLLRVGNTVAEEALVKRGDGANISAIVDLPGGSEKVPAVILAPGQGYHMRLPVLESAARALVAQGFAVFRFNWTYFSSEPRGKPSADLSLEIQDMQAVISAARAHGRVDERKVSVGGKSLGSVVAWRTFVADQKLQSALLLTPVCSRVPKGESAAKSEARENYPEFGPERRPSLWVSGNSDPLCEPVSMYGFAAAGQSSARIAIIGGDHSFENKTLPPSQAEAFRNSNLHLASALAVEFLTEASRAQR